jgi:hypothetical protein
MIAKVTIPVNAVVNMEEIQGSPPLVVAISKLVSSSSAVFDTIHWGLHVHGLEIVGTVKITRFHHHREVVLALEKYEREERILYLTDAPPMDDDALSYEIPLPTPGELGMTLKGFPPIISHVSTSSPICDLLGTGQRVDRLIIHEDDDDKNEILDWSLSSGGFTAQRVTKALLEHNRLGRRRILIVVTDTKPRKRHTDGDTMWFDWGSLRDTTSKWSLKRMLSDRPSQYTESSSQSKDYSPVKSGALL